jgi:hypothetical protein
MQQGLAMKARDPAPFVPQIEKCEVLVDEPTHVCLWLGSWVAGKLTWGAGRKEGHVP